MCRRSIQLFAGIFLFIVLVPVAFAADISQEDRPIGVAVGYAHACALLTSGEVYCWGLAHVNGQDADSSVAARVDGLPQIRAIAAGQINTCAIDTEDRAWCWGLDIQASIRAGHEVLTGPKLVENLPRVSHLASGYFHNCAVAKSDGSVWCWGGNASGELGDGTTTYRADPVRAGTLTGARWISAGVNNSCAIVQGGEVHCWGTDFQSDEGVIVHSHAPKHVDQSRGAMTVVNGRNFFCGMARGDHVFCFGSNVVNQLGRKSAGRRYTFSSPSGTDTVRDIGAGGFFACALTSSGEVKCWGVPPDSQDFAATGNDPVPIGGLPGVAGIGIGFASACAILLDGKMKCWGSNSSGQLGNGKNSEAEAQPVYVIGLPGGDEAALHAGKAHDLKASLHFGAALKEVNLALALAADSDDFLFLRAGIYQDMQQQDAALADLDELLSRNQEMVSALFARAKLHHAMGRFDRALVDLQGLVTLAPDDELARIELGLVEMHLGLASDASAEFAKVAASDPGLALVHQQVGLERFNAKDYVNALENYDIAIALSPLDDGLYRERANVYAAIGDTARAQQDFATQSQVMAAASAVARLVEQGREQMDANDFEESIKTLSKALEIVPESAEALWLRGMSFRNTNQLDLALADLDAVIALDPQDAEKYSDRGLVHADMGQTEQALADFSKAIDISPSGNAYLNRAIALYRVERFGEAIADFTDAIEFNPSEAGFYVYRAETYEKIGQYDLMIADASKALELDKNYLDALSTRASGYAAIGKYQEALRDYDQALASGVDNPVTYLRRGIAYFLLGDMAKALADMEEASSLAPDNVYDALWAEMARLRMGLPGKLSKTADRYDAKVWPFPIVELYLGKRTIEQVLAASASSDPKTKRFQHCEADFYGGEWLLAQGRRQEALTLFREANALCPFGFIEREPARSEALALDQGQ